MMILYQSEEVLALRKSQDTHAHFMPMAAMPTRAMHVAGFCRSYSPLKLTGDPSVQSVRCSGRRSAQDVFVRAAYVKTRGTGLNAITTVDGAGVAECGQTLTIRFSQDTIAVGHQPTKEWVAEREAKLQQIIGVLNESE